MSTPAIIMICMMILEWIIVAAMHGKPRQPWDIRVVTVDLALTAALLYWGGFFS